MARVKGKRPVEEACELIRTHLARRHGELAVTNPAESTDIAADRNIVRRIAEHKVGVVTFHERCVGTYLERTCAVDPVFAKQPEIAGTRHRRSGNRCGEIIGAVVLLRLRAEPFDAKIDLAHLETGSLKTEIQVEHREFAQLFGEQAIVPDRVPAQLVVGNYESLYLGIAEMLEADSGNFPPTQELTCQQSSVARDDLALRIDQYWHVEAEGFDAASDLADLPRSVGARVSRIELEVGYRSVDYGEPILLTACRWWVVAL